MRSERRLPDGDRSEIPYIFLLGAGASKKAGVPTVGEMTELFEKKIDEIVKSYVEKHDEIKDIGLQGIAPKALKNLKELIVSHGRKFDVEMLLEALIKLSDKNEVINILRPPQDDACVDVYPHLNIMLRNFIRETCEKIEDVDYLYPLKGFLGKNGLDIFTLNYDGTVEAMCEKSEIPYRDGFSPNWNPQELETSEKGGIRLYKIHGSLFWFKTGKSKYIKIPVKRIDIGNLRYFTDEGISEMIIYPLLSKEVYTGPFPWLVQAFRNKLLNTRVCIVIGYSFRDESIRKIVFEQMESNPNLWLYLIDPASEERRKDILRLHPDFFDRILTLKLKAEDALKGRTLVENQNKLATARTQEEAAKSNLLRSSTLSTHEWQTSIHIYKELEHFDRIRSMIEEIMTYEHRQSGGNYPIEWILLDLSIRFGTEYVMNGQKEKARTWFKMFRNCWASLEYSSDLVSESELPEWHLAYSGNPPRLHDQEFADLKKEIEKSIRRLPEGHGLAVILKQVLEHAGMLHASYRRTSSLDDYLGFVRAHDNVGLFKLSTQILDILEN